MTRRKLLHRMKEVCGATRHMMDDGLIVEEHQVDGTQLLIYILYSYVTEPGKRAQLVWSIIFYFFTLLEPALHYLPMDT